MEWIFLVLVAVVLVFGFGVVVWNRRRAGLGEADATPVLPSRPSSPPSAVRPEPVVAVISPARGA